MCPEALKFFEDSRILVLKEYSHTSQAFQAFDDRPALQYKNSLAKWLPAFRQFVFETAMDQWQLLLVSLATEKDVGPEHWKKAFMNCNLHPKTAVSADEWIQKNKMAVATGDLEKPFSPDLGVVAANKKPWFLTTFTDEKIAELKESYDQYLLTDEPMLDEENPLLATWDQLGVRTSYVRPLLKYFNILNAKAREDEEMQVCF
jgi:hypothetical protein